MPKITTAVKKRNYHKPLSMAIIIYTPILTKELKRTMKPKEILSFFVRQRWHVVFAPENFNEAGDLHPPAEKLQRAGIIKGGKENGRPRC